VDDDPELTKLMEMTVFAVIAVGVTVLQLITGWRVPWGF
jgi:hypothetical protein